MKITFIVYNIFGLGGTVRTVMNTANFFAGQGHDVEIVSIKRTSNTPLFKPDKNIKITPLYDSRKGKFLHPNAPLYKKIVKRILTKIPSKVIHKDEDLYDLFSLQTDIKLIQKLKNIKSGVLITTIPSFNILSAKYVNKNVIKIGQEHKEFEAHSKELQESIKKSYAELDVLTCLTDVAKKRYNDIFRDSLDVVKIENATPEYKEKSSLKEKWVITAGRLVPEKGYDRLIKIFEDVVEKHPNWKLKIFGDGKEKEKLQDLIIEKNLYNNVFLMGRTDNILEELQHASIHVVSSFVESFGMVIIEAMSVGVPTVSFTCEGPVEILSDNYDGFLIEQGNLKKFSESINQLIEDENLRKIMSKNIVSTIQKYSIESIGSKWEEIIEKKKKEKMKNS